MSWLCYTPGKMAGGMPGPTAGRGPAMAAALLFGSMS